MIFGTPNSTFLDKYMDTGGIGGEDNRPVLFDVGWEVAKKVGGIYTVLRSKAPVTVEEWGARYALVGPYNPETAPTEFEPLPAGPLTAPVLQRLQENHGINVHFGKWLVEGHPKVFLIDISSGLSRLEAWRVALKAGF
eukprot:TRINITY_DN15346_c0_g1_i1.p1 TRINITY_DN15346_c0_g1~~TRINITY_DN15346_c0_g1_i1.p1  ORF type:complete len:138 (-),score=30.43 TRINITY_DN15346_c0_g1_i1:41-454(-)